MQAGQVCYLRFTDKETDLLEERLQYRPKHCCYFPARLPPYLLSPWCDPIDGSPPGSPVPGILQARTLEWAAISFSNA